jgi:hypothetical protein
MRCKKVTGYIAFCGCVGSERGVISPNTNVSLRWPVARSALQAAHTRLR